MDNICPMPGIILKLLNILEAKQLSSIPEPIGKFDGFYYIIEYLSGLKSGLTVTEIAKEIGKSEKTVRRYLDSMEYSIFDIEVIKERGFDRKYRYRIEKQAAPFRPIFLNTLEIVALNFIRGFSHFNDFPVIQDNLNNIFKKISVSAKETKEKSGNDFQERVSGLFVLPPDLGGKVYVKRDQVNYLELLIKAVLESNTCNVLYGGGEKRKSYKLAPLHFFNYRDVIYLIAKDLNDEDIVYKNFALHRVRKLEIDENEFFEYPSDFDVSKHMKENMFKFDGQKYSIKLKFFEDAKDYVLERQWFPKQKEEVMSDGSLLLSFENEINLMLLGWIRGFGPGVEVLEPKVLRERIIEDIKVSYDNYQK